MSKETKKSNGEKKPVKATKAAPVKSAPVTAAKRPKAVQKKSETVPAAKPAAKTASKPGKATTILVRANIGFGNQMFVRGEGPGLSWERGVPMEYRESDEWQWSASGVKASFPFKVLINDQVWAQGENDQVAPGETKIVEPAF